MGGQSSGCKHRGAGGAVVDIFFTYCQHSHSNLEEGFHFPEPSLEKALLFSHGSETSESLT